MGSYLGLLWAFIRPAVFLTVIWFVFEVGFRARPATNGVPFVLWLISGFGAWFFFNEALSKGSNAVVSKGFLVRKVDFRLSILPVVSILTALIIHAIYLCILTTIFLFNGYYPDIYWLQVPIYALLLMFLLMGLNWLSCSIRVFVIDISQFISLILQIGFWATPIFWSIELVPQRYQFLIRLNPMYFIVTGYRDCFINKIWVWQRGSDLIYFIFISSFFFVLGAIVFKRLRPHFGDVI